MRSSQTTTSLCFSNFETTANISHQDPCSLSASTHAQTSEDSHRREMIHSSVRTAVRTQFYQHPKPQQLSAVLATSTTSSRKDPLMTDNVIHPNTSLSKNRHLIINPTNHSPQLQTPGPASLPSLPHLHSLKSLRSPHNKPPIPVSVHPSHFISRFFSSKLITKQTEQCTRTLIKYALHASAAVVRNCAAHGPSLRLHAPAAPVSA
jgi:hypothetical protein